MNIYYYLTKSAVFLNKILESDLFKGGKKFGEDLLLAVVIISGVVTVACIAFELLVSQVNALEEWGKHSKKVRKLLIVSVVIFCISGMYTLVVEGYFGFDMETGEKIKTAYDAIKNYYL